MGEVRGLRIEEIPLGEHLIFQERMGECLKCGDEYLKKGPRAMYCEKCKRPQHRQYIEDWGQKEKRIGNGRCFEPTKIPIPEEFRGDKWLTGMYLLAVGVMFFAVMDVRLHYSHIKSERIRFEKQAQKRDAVRFLSGGKDPKETEWMNDIFDIIGMDIYDVRRRLHIKSKEEAA